METLFKNGEGPVFYEMIKWLDSDIDHLKLSGALAVGNFARNGILFIVNKVSILLSENKNNTYTITSL
jgi:hypothetical protein